MKQDQPRQLRFALQWALESATDPATAAADWLARDVCPSAVSAISLLTSPDTSVRHLRRAKDAFKTMRVLGETKADRRMGGRMYLAAIAAAIVHHDKRISRQSDDALVRALQDMAFDDRIAYEFRTLAGKALAAIESGATRGSGASSSGSFNGTGHETPEEDEIDDALPLEIERTYLLNRLPSLPQSVAIVRIEQGYLPDDAALKGRLRHEVRDDGSERYTHTIKKGSGLVRSEVEREITIEEFEAHWPATDGHRLTKTRYIVPSNGFEWEIDVFEQLRIVLAEVELPTATTIATPPPWLRPHIVREVTHEKQYRNHQLALQLARQQAAG